MPSSLIGLAGEYYTLGKLAHQGITGALTLSHTKGVDILAASEEGDTYRVEAKTSTSKAKTFGHLGDSGKYFSWRMHKKHESCARNDLIFVFVLLLDPYPRFFVVPSKDVQDHVTAQHQQFLKRERKKVVKDGDMRVFHIRTDDPQKYENNWQLLETKKQKC